MSQTRGKIHYVPLLNGEVGYRKEFSTKYVGIQHLARVNGVIGGSGKKFYYHNDHLGSALAVTDEYGNKVVERDFTPFGERINTDVYDGGHLFLITLLIILYMICLIYVFLSKNK